MRRRGCELRHAERFVTDGYRGQSGQTPDHSNGTANVNVTSRGINAVCKSLQPGVASNQFTNSPAPTHFHSLPPMLLSAFDKCDFAFRFRIRGSKLHRVAMGIFQRKPPKHLVSIHPDNITSKDWIILLEAGTIVGPAQEKIRIARTTQERKVVNRYDVLLRTKPYLVVEGFDPRIHAVYFCPQLYKYDTDKKLVPLEGEEIGRLIANALEGGIKDKRPWYEPSEKLSGVPAISTPMLTEFDTLVVEMPKARSVAAAR
jgi:hypothetical protein